jgi:hypothetical protein
MRKIINITALGVFIWLLIDAFNVIEALITFLLVGEIPGTGLRLSPSVMLLIMTAGFFLVVFEIFSRRHAALRAWRKQLFATFSRAKS